MGVSESIISQDDTLLSMGVSEYIISQEDAFFSIDNSEYIISQSISSTNTPHQYGVVSKIVMDSVIVACELLPLVALTR